MVNRPGMMSQKRQGLSIASPFADRGWDPMQRHHSTDFVYPILASRYTLRALLGNLPEADAATIPWMAPGSILLSHTPGLFAGLPKTCIVAGGAEQTLDAMLVLREVRNGSGEGEHQIQAQSPGNPGDFPFLGEIAKPMSHPAMPVVPWRADQMQNPLPSPARHQRRQAGYFHHSSTVPLRFFVFMIFKVPIYI
ncbi:hypothetical protein BDZ97DRAFT_1862639 [Flammula alnicola]|nr:hypothetical protein BDZ97DRAFT_1862639 [Flammula alnicola]